MRIVLRIEKIISSGDGIAWGDGKTFFVPDTIPGELVEVTECQPVRRAFRATRFRLIETVATRREPPCPLFGRCGGCHLLHMNATGQERAKRGIVADLFGQKRREPPTGLRWVGLGETGLRTRAKVHIVAGRPTFMRRGSHEPVPFDTCPLLHPGLNEVLRADAVMRPDGAVHYEFAPGDGGWSPRDPVVTKQVGGERFRVSRGSFFQASEEGATALAGLFREVLDRTRPGRVLDLFCGVGLFSRFALLGGSVVTGMELSESAAVDFAVNLEGKGRFIAADLDRIDALPPADLIVVDPPRSGLAPHLIDLIAAAPVRDLCYVSCDGATFVRDLDLLEERGRFLLDALTIVDQFPATRHLELVALLRRET